MVGSTGAELTARRRRGSWRPWHTPASQVPVACLTMDGENDGVSEDSRSQGHGGHVWIFNGEATLFASGVFADAISGLEWVAKHGLTGILTEYQVGDGCYDLAVTQGRFRNTKPHHGTAGHVAGFSPGLGHIHVRDGQPDLSR
jgi:hypothetical protein